MLFPNNVTLSDYHCTPHKSSGFPNKINRKYLVDDLINSPFFPPQMASDLVDLLHDATVTRGAQGIAYSCLLDVLSQQGEYGRGLQRLNEALHRGVKLEDVNR